MSKERDLLDAMRESLQGGAASEAASTTGAADATTGLASAWDMVSGLAYSMAGDPLFYVKVLGILILTVVIITISVELIAEGG